MALLKPVNDPVYTAIPALIASGLGRFPGAALNDVELAEVFPVCLGRVDKIIDREVPESQVFEDADRVHVQIFVDKRPRYFARLERSDATGKGWRLTQISESTITEKIEAGIEVVQTSLTSENEIMTLLEVPAYYFVGLLLSGDNARRVLPVEFPKRLGVDGYTFYDLHTIREKFRQSAVLGLGLSGNQSEDA